MIASIMFVILIFIFSGTVVAYSLFHGNGIFTQIALGLNLVALAYSIILTLIYRIKYNSKDLLRSDEEEINH